MNGKTKWILIALATSLAVNVFAVGIFIGREFRAEKGMRGGPREHIEFNMRRLATYLPEENQGELKAILKDHRRNLRGHFRDMREREDQIKALLVAPEVDMQALEQALEAHEMGMMALKAPLRSIILDVVARLDQETRQALAKDLFDKKGKRPKWKHRRERPDFGPEGPPPPQPSEEGRPD